MSEITETREQRAARMRAQEQADRDHRASLPPLSTDALGMSMGNVKGYDPRNPSCGRCGRDEPVGVIFGVMASGIAGKLCQPCIESVGPYGEALVALVEGVEQIDSAIHFAPAEDKVALVATAQLLVGRWLPERFGLTGPEATESAEGVPVNCGNCGRAASGCSWAQNPAAGRGDCCTRCNHGGPR